MRRVLKPAQQRGNFCFWLVGTLSGPGSERWRGRVLPGASGGPGPACGAGYGRSGGGMGGCAPEVKTTIMTGEDEVTFAQSTGLQLLSAAALSVPECA